MPGACSLAVQVVLRELNQSVELIDITKLDNFKSVNPVGAVPVLVEGDKVLREGAAIMIYLLDRHNSDMLPAEGEARQDAIQNIMFANATMHPAYGRLFFIAQNVTDSKVKQEALDTAAVIINDLWQVVDKQLEGKTFLDGNDVSAADILLTVYSQWGEYFPVDIKLGENVERMVKAVSQRESFLGAVAAEQDVQAAS
jgi:glutathione S-transferase